jgi:hypothetical protein
MGFPPSLMQTVPTKGERDAENRMIRLESWATMVMHTMIGKREVTNTDLLKDDSIGLYAKWVSELAFAIAARMEEERGKLVQLPEPMGP